MRKSLATLMAAVIISAGMVGSAEAVPPNPCNNKLTPLARVNSADSGKRIYAMARSKKMLLPNQHNSVKVAIQVWSPNPKHKNGGQWTRLGKEDYDQNPAVSVAVTEAPLLPGNQKYRAAALFVCRTKEKVYQERRIGKPQTFIRNNTPFYGVDVRTGNISSQWNGKGNPDAWGKKLGSGWTSGGGW